MLETFVVLSIGSKTLAAIAGVVSFFVGIVTLPWTRRAIAKAVHRRINEPV